MSFTSLMSRITRRGRRRSSGADRALSDARADAALEQRRRRDERNTHHATGGSFGSGGGGGF